MRKHYTSEYLDQYRHGDMKWLSWLICRIHLRYCWECQQRLAQLEEDDRFLLKIKRSVKLLKSESNSASCQELCITFRDKIKP